LPHTELSPINVNTLTEGQFPLLMMLLPGQLPEASARKLIVERPSDGYSSMVDFWRLPALGGVTPAAEVLGQPQLRTQWFGLDIAIELGGIQFRQSSLLDGRMDGVKTVRRSFGGNS
jgi:general secretion pathway protein K